MSTIVSGFLTQSPQKVLERADIYSKSTPSFMQRSRISMNCHWAAPNRPSCADWPNVALFSTRTQERDRLLDTAI